jgi:hypothetical protein
MISSVLEHLLNGVDSTARTYRSLPDITCPLPLYGYIILSRENVTLTLKISSHSLMLRVRYTRDSPHNNGQCIFLPSWVYRLSAISAFIGSTIQ